jgi:hypothetical protein
VQGQPNRSPWLAADSGAFVTHGLIGALDWSYGSPDSTSGDENRPLTFHPQYTAALHEVWTAQH